MKTAAVAVLTAVSAWGQTMSLQQALDTAGTASPEIQSARLRVLESQAVAKSVRSGLLPQVSASVSGAYQTSNLQGIGLIQPGIPSRVGPYRLFDARPAVTMRVLDLSLLAGVRAAQARAHQNEAEAAAVGERTRAAIIDLYLQALEADSRARASQARVATAEAVVRQTGDSEQAGRSSKLDVARATGQLEKERASLVEARMQRDVVTTLLQQTIGLEARAPVTLAALAPRDFSWDVDRDAVVREALEARPERRAVAAKGIAVAREVEQAERQRWPKLDFFSNYGALGQGPDRALATWQVGASLNVPLWTSGRIENDTKAARYRREQWQEEDRQLRLAIEQEITQAIVEGRAVVERVRHLAAAADAARETLELARLRYQAGMTTNLDVVTAQGEVALSEEESIRAQYTGWLAEAKLARARGDVRRFAEGR